MKRRPLLLALPLLLTACGLSERPYAERRQWPLLVRRPVALPPRPGGRILELRSLQAGPGLEQRGLQTLRADGSISVAYYEEWAVPPAEGVEDGLRNWLAASGKFGGVVNPASRMSSDLIVEGELSALWTIAATQRAHATVSATAIDQRGNANRILMQQSFTADAAIAGTDVGSTVQAQLAALADIFGQIEAAIPV